jgi:hypothetical protein
MASINAQIDSLAKSSGFQGTLACIKTREVLNQVLGEIESFVSGKFQLSAPIGLLTQDGINVSSMLDFPTQLRLGIGFLFNLDFCGEHRFSLNAARDAVILDDQADRVINHLYQRIGTFLGEWFREEKVPALQVSKYQASVPRLLGEYVRRASGVS